MLISNGYLGLIFLVSNYVIWILKFQIRLGSYCFAIFGIVMFVFSFWYLHKICRTSNRVAWALESPNNEFIWGSYVQNTNRLSWKSTMRFLFCLVRICLAIFETIRAISGFWCLHKRIVVAWALESPQNEFVWGSYVQNTNRLSWKSTMSFMFCHFWGCSNCFGF